MEVAERSDELGRSLAVITFVSAPMLLLFEREIALLFAFYGDPERRAYEAFGFGRASTARVWLDPRVLSRYAGLLARGRRTGRPAQDTLQLGGDVLVDAAGVVEWVYSSSGPEDRPSVDAIVAARR